MANYQLTFGENFALTGVAASLSKTVAAPIERVKLLIQNQGELIKQRVIDKPYSGILNCTIRTYQSDGLVAFWRGNWASVIRYIPMQAMNFAFKDSIKAQFKISPNDSKMKQLSRNMLSGGIAGSISITGDLPVNSLRLKIHRFSVKNFYAENFSMGKFPYVFFKIRIFHQKIFDQDIDFAE